MAQLKIIDPRQYLSKIPGCNIYFYEAFTKRPIDTYSDSKMETVNTNPVMLDSRGGFDVFMKEGEEYAIEINGKRLECYKHPDYATFFNFVEEFL